MSSTRAKIYAFPIFSVISTVLHKVLTDQGMSILITPAWKVQSWYPQLLRPLIQNPLTLPKIPDLLEDPNKEYHPLIAKGNLQPLPWTVSRKDYIQKEYQSNIKGIRHNHLLRIVQT